MSDPTTARTTLAYAQPVGPSPMPTGAVILLSLALPGLGSLLLRGRRALPFVLALIGAVVASVCAVGGFLALIPQRAAADFADGAGWLLVAGYALVLGLGLRRALRDRRQVVAEGLPQAAPPVLWITLFWVATVAAALGLAAALFTLGFGIIWGGSHPLVVGLLAATCVASLALVAVVASTLTRGARQPG